MKNKVLFMDKRQTIFHKIVISGIANSPLCANQEHLKPIYKVQQLRIYGKPFLVGLCKECYDEFIDKPRSEFMKPASETNEFHFRPE